ncbi:MAG: DUF1223 domain-containing protein [Betaproteobacteria bacterium]|nr:DUF1223 domain-containing protein [Betaproteobacteria bacterium]
MRTRFAAAQILLCLLCLPALSGAAAPACTATSGKLVPAVVELYTSEGCDSCPPADRWLAALKDHAATGKVVPLAFHIDYWDYLGWKDRFADPAFGVRHREAASRGGARVVYTPQVLVEGREFQKWRRTSPDKVAATAAAKAARADLRVSAAPAAAGKVLISVAGRALPGARAAAAYVALFESGLSSDVKSGENKGVVLRHDFVVRRWLGPFAFDAGALELTQTLALPDDAVPGQSGVAVIAVDDRGSTLQALALPLRDCGG